MLSELIAYAFGKRKARKDQEAYIERLIEEEESESFYDYNQQQDTRSLEQLIKEARENRASKNNQ